MLTKSVIGRFLMLAIFIVAVGVVAQAALIFTSGGKKAVKTASADSVAPVAPSDPAASDPVRVVYPGPLGDTAVQKPKLADAAPASPLAAPAPGTTAKLAQAMGATAAPSAAPATPVVASADPAPAAASQPAPAPAAASDSAQAAATPDTAPAATAPAGVQVASLGGGAPATDPTPSTGVNINTASVEILNHLGGGHIGQSIARHRPYASIDDLVKKRVLRRSVFDQIRHQIAAK